MLASLLLIITSLSPLPTATQTNFLAEDSTIEQNQSASRFYVKYHTDKKAVALELLKSLELTLIDSFDDQQVLVIEGESSIVELLNDSPSIEYTEPVPIRSLF
ncbi:hypothetical protein P0F40_000877 [Vibrio metschnikovii]|uniref:hypothetical protein n=1 Tax=Vibrio metschnikovii TaxID=28172 RepID=UPI0029F99358|nr:hypothetical protein [Vibrio metschnikovii]EKO3663604.1 hypothetical protein [Vibrio metschnikovii]EKO3685342.1 hypothetical protein [Vibrio metschnikovii]EKO3688723.1 hypothetical protein [Vibrio metschnikovii]EKO3696527.1 hypothetical protein [Vibrio metschnikovii]